MTEGVALRERWWSEASSWRTVPLRDRWVLIVLALLLVLNRGFSSLAIPPGIPIAELTLVAYLGLINWPVFLPRLLRDVPAVPYLLWWGLGIATCLFASRTYGFFAFRDAGFVLDSVALLVGYAFARSEFQIYVLFRWLRVVLFVGLLYSLTLPFGPFLISLASVPGTHGRPNPILGQYLNADTICMLGAVFAFVIPPKRVLLRQLAPAFFALLVATTAIEYQSRGYYLLVLVTIVVLSLTYPQQAWRLWATPFIFVFALLLIQISGIELNGRLGKVSLDFVVQHFASLSGKASGEAAQGAAYGVLQRYDWWHNVITKWLASPQNFFLGIGYGLPLIDFVDPDGLPVRDPHNSYLTVLGRTGIVGSLAWLWINVHLVIRWARAFTFTRRQGYRIMQGNLLICLIFFIACWLGALGEPAFEYPFNTIIYYFLAGVILRYASLQSKAEGSAGPAEA